jgi:hypothetical protein
MPTLEGKAGRSLMCNVSDMYNNSIRPGAGSNEHDIWIGIRAENEADATSIVNGQRQ